MTVQFSPSNTVPTLCLEMEEREKCDKSATILHIAVVGFHHKRGTILEYSYPPLCEGERRRFL